MILTVNQPMSLYASTATAAQLPADEFKLNFYDRVNRIPLHVLEVRNAKGELTDRMLILADNTGKLHARHMKEVTEAVADTGGK